MKIASGWLRRFLADESGQDLVEYALLAAIIGVAGALVLPGIGPKMSTLYQQWGNQVYNAWEPPAPVP
jgi:Flp pilus assembly pilin Flp